MFHKYIGISYIFKKNTNFQIDELTEGSTKPNKNWYIIVLYEPSQIMCRNYQNFIFLSIPLGSEVQKSAKPTLFGLDST